MRVWRRGKGRGGMVFRILSHRRAVDGMQPGRRGDGRSSRGAGVPHDALGNLEEANLPPVPPGTALLNDKQFEFASGTPDASHVTGGTGGKAALMITHPRDSLSPGDHNRMTFHDGTRSDESFRKGPTLCFQVILRKAHILGESQARGSLRSDILANRTTP
jgi:hypothetical protein